MGKSKRRFFKNISYLAQREIRTIKGIENILALDEAHWSATGASIESIICDPVFLDLVDSDDNKRIMCFEIKEAIRWLFRNLNDKKAVIEESTALHIDTIDTSHTEGKSLYQSALQILQRLGRENEKVITLNEIRQIKEKVKATPISEAGVVLPEATDDPQIRQMLEDIIKTIGGAPHPLGNRGVTLEKLNEFITNGAAFLQWYKKGETKEGQTSSTIMILGESTDPAFRAYAGIKDKIDHYFTLCKMIGFSDGMEIIDSACKADTEEQLKERIFPDVTDPVSIESYLIKAPLAVPRKERILFFDQCINTYFEDQVALFRKEVMKPMFGEKDTELTEAQWKRIKSMFVEYEKWQGEKKGEIVSSIPPKTLKGYLNNKLINRIKELIAESNETALVLDEIRLIEKLVLFQSLMLTFLNNFVSFPYLYDPGKRAMFEMGTLIIDGRRFTLSVRVDDHDKHLLVARHSNMYILYVNVLSSTEKKYEIAVPVTSGNKGNLYIGKHGIFHDIHNTDWDAEIIDIVENPISLGEALSRPFKNLIKLINTKIEEFKSAAESKLGTVIKGEAVPGQQQQAAAGAAQPAAQPKNQGLGNLFMGGSIAVAALGSAIAFITKTLSEVKWTTMVITILGALFAVLFPTFISAFLKLNKRDMTTILEASGWAINIRMKLGLKLGKFFTFRPKMPFRSMSFRWLAWFLVILLAGGLAASFFFFSPSVTVSCRKKITFSLLLCDRIDSLHGKYVSAEVRDMESSGGTVHSKIDGFFRTASPAAHTYRAVMTSGKPLQTGKRYFLHYFIDVDGNGTSSAGDIRGVKDFDVLPDAEKSEAVVFIDTESAIE
ncbi:MAG: hypothetical protein JW881_08790 [Spirochaetales bacterium]|nr:hypothetical protein [Spirochaetales bacterium]